MKANILSILIVIVYITLCHGQNEYQYNQNHKEYPRSLRRRFSEPTNL